MSKKILFLCSGGFLPYKTGNGNAVLTFAMISCFKRLGYDLTVAPISIRCENKVYIEHKNFLKNYCNIYEKNVLYYPKSYSFLKFNILQKILSPKEDDYFYSKEEASSLIDFYNQNNFDLVYIYDWEAVPLIKYFPSTAKIVVSLVDLIDEYQRLRWSSLFTNVSPTGFIKTLISLIIDRNKPKYAYKILERTNVIIEHANQHAKKLISLGYPNVYYIPHPLPQRDLIEKLHEPNKIIISMIGSLKGTASKKGFLYLIKYILPFLENESCSISKEYEIRIIGHGNLSGKIREKICSFKQCKIIGYSNNLEEEYALADIILVTIPVPHGFRTRIAEAFSYGKCVVAHSANAYGMPEMENGNNALLANKGHELAKQLIKALNSFELRKKIGQNAFNTFNSTLSEVAGSLTLQEAINFLS